MKKIVAVILIDQKGRYLVEEPNNFNDWNFEAKLFQKEFNGASNKVEKRAVDLLRSLEVEIEESELIFVEVLQERIDYSFVEDRDVFIYLCKHPIGKEQMTPPAGKVAEAYAIGGVLANQSHFDATTLIQIFKNRGW